MEPVRSISYTVADGGVARIVHVFPDTVEAGVGEVVGMVLDGRFGDNIGRAFAFGAASAVDCIARGAFDFSDFPGTVGRLYGEAYQLIEGERRLTDALDDYCRRLGARP